MDVLIAKCAILTLSGVFSKLNVLISDDQNI